VSMDHERTREVELPPGVHVKQLQDLDLESPEAVGRFVEQFGNPGHALWRTGPEWTELQRAWEVYVGDEGRPSDLPWQGNKELAERLAQQIRAHPGTSPYWLDEFRERARLVRDVVRVHLYTEGHGSLRDVQGSWESRYVPAPATESRAADIARVVLNWSLSSFQPMLQSVDMERLPSDPVPRFEDALPHQPRLFEVLSLQLFNDIAARAKYRRCPACNGWYNIVPKGQLPGGEKVALRSSPDAESCRPECTQVLEQRKYRKRQTLRRRLNRLLADAGPAPDWASLLDAFTTRYSDYHFDSPDEFRSACQAAGEGGSRELFNEIAARVTRASARKTRGKGGRQETQAP